MPFHPKFDLTQPHRPTPSGTNYMQPNVQKFIRIVTIYLETASIQDTEFGMSPKIVLDDWRQAQLFLKGASSEAPFEPT